VFFGFVLLYLLQFVIIGFTKKNAVSMETVKIGSVDLPRVMDGVIIRDETVYKTAEAGALHYQVAEYERVKKGAAVCIIQDIEATAQIQQDIEQVDASLIKLQERRAGFSDFSEKEKNINQQIKSMIDNRLYQFSLSDLSGAYALKDLITQNVRIRDDLVLSDDQGSAGGLASQRRALLRALAENTAVISVDRSGVVSFHLDGQEENFTPENMSLIPKDQIPPPGIHPADIPLVIPSAPQEEAAVETPVFKMINSNIWYIGAYIPNELLEECVEGGEQNLFIEEQDQYRSLPARIKTITAGDKESFILYECAKNMLEYLDQRAIRFKTIDSARTGYKISRSAIAEKTEDGAPVQGVYRVNNGTAEFRRVILPEDGTGDSGYFILDPAVNKNIQVYDKIVTDASQVQEDQIIYP
jgi:hypothetical protein